MVGPSASFHADVNEEVSTILASDFDIEVTRTNSVPHSDDVAITFPNLDTKSQGTKLIETAGLYEAMDPANPASRKRSQQTAAPPPSSSVPPAPARGRYF